MVHLRPLKTDSPATPIKCILICGCREQGVWAAAPPSRWANEPLSARAHTLPATDGSPRRAGTQIALKYVADMVDKSRGYLGGFSIYALTGKHRRRLRFMSSFQETKRCWQLPRRSTRWCWSCDRRCHTLIWMLFTHSCENDISVYQLTETPLCRTSARLNWAFCISTTWTKVWNLVLSIFLSVLQPCTVNKAMELKIYRVRDILHWIILSHVEPSWESCGNVAEVAVSDSTISPFSTNAVPLLLLVHLSAQLVNQCLESHIITVPHCIGYIGPAGDQHINIFQGLELVFNLEPIFVFPVPRTGS